MWHFNTAYLFMGVQVLERDLPAHEFEKKRAKLNGKRKKDYLRVPVPHPAPSVLACCDCGKDQCFDPTMSSSSKWWSLYP